MSDQIRNPYVGPRPFTKEERAFFFGRKREASVLSSLVIAKPLVLFYAQSGAGKTSLINTSLIPALEERGFEVLPVGRVFGESKPRVKVKEDFNIFVYNLLLSLHKSEHEEGANRFTEKTLAEFLDKLVKKGDYYYYDETVTPTEILPRALIIDQFEEIFTAHPEAWEKQEDFFNQLAKAINDDPYLSVVLSIREDYVARLDRYAHLLPDNLRTRFYMQRMDNETALRAVMGPAEKIGRPFANSAAQKLVDNLRQVRIQTDGSYRRVKGQFVQPVQLQVVCHQLWKNLIKHEAQRPPAKGKAGKQITFSDLKRLAEGKNLAQFVDDALAEFYQEAITNVAVEDKPGQTEFDLREWFETKLITTDKTRAPVRRGKRKTGGLDNSIVKELRGQFLLQAERRAGSTWYELVHDRFIDPILKANAEWRQDHPLIQVAWDWKDASEPDSKLYQGEQLTEALEDPDRKIPLVREFLEAGRKAEREREQARKAVEEKKRSQLRKRALVVVGALLGIAVIAFLFALGGWNAAANHEAEAKDKAILAATREAEARAAEAEAKALRDEAEKQARIAAADRLAALASTSLDIQTDPAPALLLSLEALKVATTIDARSSLLKGLTRGPRLVTLQHSTADPVNLAIFSPDGQTLAAAHADGTITLWDLTESPPSANVLYRSSDPVTSIAFSLDGHTLASASPEGPITLWNWNVETGEWLPGLPIEPGTLVTSLAFRPKTEGQVLAVGSADSTIILWDIGTGEPIGDPLRGYTEWMNSIAFSPDGQTLASASDDGVIILWDIETGEAIGRPLTGHEGPVTSVAFHPNDDRTLASASSDSTIRLWNIETGEAIGDPLTGHTKWVNSVAFSPDGKTLASASDDRTVGLWDVTSRWPKALPLVGHTARARSVAFSPDRQILASASDDGTIILWNIEKANPLGQLLAGHTDLVRSVTFSPDGQTLASAGDDGMVILWDIETGEPLGEPLFGHEGPVTSVAFSRDSQTLASASADTTIILWDVEKREKLGSPLTGHTDWVSNVAFSPGGQILASGSADETIILWDATDGEPIDSLTHIHRGAVNSLAFSPDGETLASGHADGDIILWDVAHRQRLVTFREHEEALTSLAFSPDGEVLASASGDTRVILWDVKERNQIAPLTDHDDWVNSLAFSRDGNTLASASADGDILFWDITDINLPQPFDQPLTGHRGSVWSVAFSPDGNTLASAGSDSIVVLWQVSLAAWKELACQRVGRNLTQPEWEAAFWPGEEYHVTCDDFPVPPSVIEAKNAQAKEHARRCRKDEALAAFADALQLTKTGGTVTAEEVTRILVERGQEFLLNPAEEVTRILVERGQEFLLNGEDIRARTCFEQANALDPDLGLNLAVLEEIGPQLQSVQQSIGEKQYDKTLAALDRAIEHDPEFTLIQQSGVARILVDLCVEGASPACERVVDLAEEIAFGRTATGELQANRSDIWTFEGQAGQFVTIAMSEDGSDVDSYLTLSGPDGYWLTHDDNSGGGSNSLISDFLPDDGSYLIVAEGLGGGSGAYTLSLAETIVKPIAFGETVSTDIEDGPIWTFEGRAGQIIRIEMNEDGSGLDTFLSLRGPFGSILVTDEDGGSGTNSLIRNYILTDDGIYAILPGGDSDSGAYTLSLAEAVLEEIAFGDRVRGDIEDGRVWAFEGEIGQIVRIAMNEDDSGLNTFLTLVGPDGFTLITDDDGGDGTNSLIKNYVLTEDGSYTILPDAYSDSGAYTLSLAETFAEPIVFGETVSADIEDGLIWAFQGEAGQIVRLAMDEDDSGIDTLLTLRGPDGFTLITDDDGGSGTNSLIKDFVLTQEGSYTILPDAYSDSGAYTLSLAEVVPEGIKFDETVRGDIEDGLIWTFEGEAGQIVSIAMAEDDSGINTLLTLRGPDGFTLITDDDGGKGTNSLIKDFVLTQEGSYTILPDGDRDSGAYTLSLAEVVPEGIKFDETVRGDIEDGLIWAFEGEAGQIVQIAMNEDDSGVDTFLTLLGPDGFTLITDDDGGSGTNSLIKDFVLTQDGSYTILPDGDRDSGAYTLSLAETVVESIAFGETVSADIEDGLIWTFEGRAGQIIRIEMNEDDSGIDTLLTLRGPDEFTLITDDDGGSGTNSLIDSFVLTQDGSYTILPDGDRDSGAYTLSLWEVEIDPNDPDAPYLLHERGDAYAQQRDYEQAIADYERAMADYEWAIELDRDHAGRYHNQICWFGSLLGHAADVIDACEQAVQLASADRIAGNRDSRGLARALTGDYAGAIEDFEVFVEWSKANGSYVQYGSKREGWIAELAAGRNPFDEATLDALRNE
jgi:WD40 repeat protein